jgi:uncharacterized protein (TIGR02444 family)
MDVQGFWSFSLRFYAHTAVRKACLEAQDQYGLRVNVLLLGCYLAQEKASLEAADWRHAVDSTDNWYQGVVLPLRASRRALLPGPFRERIKVLELEAEQEEQQHLWAALDGLCCQPEASVADAASANLQVLWEQVSQDPLMPECLYILARRAESPA